MSNLFIERRIRVQCILLDVTVGMYQVNEETHQNLHSPSGFFKNGSPDSEVNMPACLKWRWVLSP
jgi:hypothetical protein